MFNLFKTKIDLITSLEDIVARMQDGRILTLQNDKYSPQTFYSYKSAVNHFKDFSSGMDFYANNINEQMMDDFSKWLIKNNFSKNNIWNCMKCIKTLINRMVSDGILPEVQIGKLTVRKENPNTVYNTQEEIDKLVNMDLSLTDRLKKVRDIYVIQCYTGLRFSDIKKFMASPKAYIKNTGSIQYIDIVTTKTKQQVTIPLKPCVIKILEENNYKFGKPFSLQHYNYTLKFLAEYAEIDDEIVMVRTVGGKRKEWVVKKFQVMSSHTARRSFATNAFLAGISSLQIRKITGHTTEESFLRYIRASSLENTMSLLNHPFFS